MGDTSEARHRRRASIVILIASAFALTALAWFTPDVASTGESGRNMTPRYDGWVVAARTLAGVFGLAALLVARRAPMIARGMVAMAGLSLLAVLVVALREVTVLALIAVGVPGFALLIAAPYMGPFPRSEAEAAPGGTSRAA